MNFLADAVTFGTGMDFIWTGLGNAMSKVKDAVYGILPQLMTFLGDAWIILIPFGLFIIRHRVRWSGKKQLLLELFFIWNKTTPKRR